MRRLDLFFMIAIVFLVFWVFTCTFYPFLGLVLTALFFVLLVGFSLFILIGLWYRK